MNPALVEALAQLGVACVVFGLAFSVFYKMHKAAMDAAKERENHHAEERKEWRDSVEKNSEKVSSAIDNLAHSINAKRL